MTLIVGISELLLEFHRILGGILDEGAAGGDSGHAEHELQGEFDNVCHIVPVLIVLESFEETVNESVDGFANVIACFQAPVGHLLSQSSDARREVFSDSVQDFHKACG